MEVTALGSLQLNRLRFLYEFLFIWTLLAYLGALAWSVGGSVVRHAAPVDMLTYELGAVVVLTLQLFRALNRPDVGGDLED